jgi:hypothetical protein
MSYQLSSASTTNIYTISKCAFLFHSNESGLSHKAGVDSLSHFQFRDDFGLDHYFVTHRMDWRVVLIGFRSSHGFSPSEVYVALLVNPVTS